MERKKTQATTAKLKKVQTEIKKTKDKLNKLMAEEERLTVQYQTESYFSLFEVCKQKWKARS